MSYGDNSGKLQPPWLGNFMPRYRRKLESQAILGGVRQEETEAAQQEWAEKRKRSMFRENRQPSHFPTEKMTISDTVYPANKHAHVQDAVRRYWYHHDEERRLPQNDRRRGCRRNGEDRRAAGEARGVDRRKGDRRGADRRQRTRDAATRTQAPLRDMASSFQRLPEPWRLARECSIPPLEITGLEYPVLVTDTRLYIGCEGHSVRIWQQLDDAMIASFDGKKSLSFWRRHKRSILALAEAHQRKIVF